MKINVGTFRNQIRFNHMTTQTKDSKESLFLTHFPDLSLNYSKNNLNELKKKLIVTKQLKNKKKEAFNQELNTKKLRIMESILNLETKMNQHSKKEIENLNLTQLQFNNFNNVIVHKKSIPIQFETKFSNKKLDNIEQKNLSISKELLSLRQNYEFQDFINNSNKAKNEVKIKIPKLPKISIIEKREEFKREKNKKKSRLVDDFTLLGLKSIPEMY